MECVRDAISGAREFSTSGFEPWSRICVDDRVVLVQRHVDLFEAHVVRRKEESY